MQYLTAVIIGLPMLSALAGQLLGAILDRQVARLSIFLLGLTTLLAALNLWHSVTTGTTEQLALADDWGILLFDPLSALMLFVVALISLIVHIYSKRYMAEEPGYVRFFVLLDLMTTTLLAMVAAGDLITLLITWHLVGVLLYLLLGQDTRSHTAYRYAFWTLFTYRFGDLPLVLAAALLYNAFGTWSLPEIFAAILANPAQHTVFGFPLPYVVAALVALAAFARSAQFLLHTWLPYTMSGPTPVSALMHAGIVNAGGFLVNRFAPVFVHSDGVLHWMFVVGLVTAIVGSVLMLAQHDIKKSLGYSTMGQMGFMIMECGVGAFSLAIYHLIAHGVFKGTLFLGSGSIINQARTDDGVPKKDLYTFVVDRKPAPQRRPWLLMAAFTLVVPAVILFFAHYFVEQNFFEKQGAIILLFFGWMTGAQLMFATHHMQTENVFRQFALILVSFTVVVIGYTFIAHAFELFLYPDPAFRAQIHAAAGIDLNLFTILASVIAVVIVMGWLLTYYTEIKRPRARNWSRQIRHKLYGVISREFYVGAVYNEIARKLINGADKLNTMLRWR